MAKKLRKTEIIKEQKIEGDSEVLQNCTFKVQSHMFTYTDLSN